MIWARLAEVAAFFAMPFFLTGLVNRVKSLWTGRKGPPILQSLYDMRRLFRKSPVYSTTSTFVFRISPWIFLVTSAAAAAFVPLLGLTPWVSFPFDFVWFAYMWGLGRVMIMLSALDTGSSFEGMGAAREATFSTMLEPVLFMVFGALCMDSGAKSLHDALTLHPHDGISLFVRFFSIAALFIALQVESSRMPVDDPGTHLELTMVHEAMVLDHSGPELAAIQWASAMKLMIGASVIANLINPWSGSVTVRTALLNLSLTMLVAMAIGAIESLIARLRLREVPKYIVAALAAGAVSLLAAVWRSGSAQ